MPAKTHIDEYIHHLNRADHHLTGALKLLYGDEMPRRTPRYQRRLEKAQIAVSGLYQHEINRQRRSEQRQKDNFELSTPH